MEHPFFCSYSGIVIQNRAAADIFVIPQRYLGNHQVIQTMVKSNTRAAS